MFKHKKVKIKYLISSFIHFLLPSKCDFCFKELKGNDYQRICLNCVKKILKEIQFLKKKKCSVCDASGVVENSYLLKNGLCQNCLENNFVFKKNVSLFFYYNLGKKLMTYYKIEKHSSYAKLIADLLAKKYLSFFFQFGVIVPIVLLKRDLFERDFCPVWQVLKKLYQKYDLPMMRNIIVKNKKYKKTPQHFKNKQQRKIEITGKYHYNKRYKNILYGKKILIIDDVFTTGATMNEIAGLISNNNEEVTIYSMSFARTIFND